VPTLRKKVERLNEGKVSEIGRDAGSPVPTRPKKERIGKVKKKRHWAKNILHARKSETLCPGLEKKRTGKNGKLIEYENFQRKIHEIIPTEVKRPSR